MAITFVGSGDAATINGGDPTITLPSMLQDDLVVVVAGDSQQLATVGFTTAGYTTFISGLQHSGSGPILWAGYKFMGASPDASVQVSNNSGSTHSCSAVALVFRGVDLTTPLDATTTTTDGTSTNPDSPSITTVNGGVVMSAFTSEVLDASVTMPSGYSDQIDESADDNNDIVTGAAWKAVGAATAEDPASWTNVSSGAWIAISIALREAAGGGGAVTRTFGFIF